MNETVPQPPVNDAVSVPDRTRCWSVLSAVLFLPAAAVAVWLALASEQASACMTYGEPCGSSLPGWLFMWGVGVGGMGCLVALAAPRVRVRRAAVTVQLLAECAALLVILSHA
ncbi:hypothetical protein GCM10010252_08090 [Streptomyces aureoverticillatus]|nr:hypothetical protein GCM10010252_08090 [Streptomyces aureoverticillatus]